jgi:hypothetical protein
MAGPGNEPAKCRLTAFPYYHGMLLEPVDFLVLLIGTLPVPGGALSCSGSRRPWRRMPPTSLIVFPGRVLSLLRSATANRD